MWMDGLGDLTTHGTTCSTLGTRKAYRCEVCNGKFRFRNELERHAKVHESVDDPPEEPQQPSKKSWTNNIPSKVQSNNTNTGTKNLTLENRMPYGCGICSERFRIKKDLKRHFEVHIQQDRNECPNCKTKFPDLILHLMCEHITEDKPHTCQTCLASFIDVGTLTRHLKIHMIDKPYKCEICNKRFTRLHHIKRHVLTHTDRPRPYVCETCDKSFAEKHIWKEHLYIHQENKPFKCTFCSRKFKQLSKLKVHLRTHSELPVPVVKIENRKEFVCEVCGSSYSTKKYLRQHMGNHLEADSRCCNMCSKECVSGEDLKNHLLSKHSANICEFCQKIFFQRKKFLEHLRVHTGEKPYVCEICFKSFRRKNHLSGHFRTHTNEKPYICSVCSQAFANSSSLKLHSRIHTQEKPYVCSICGEGFIASNYLKNHLLAHTGEKPELFSCEICEKKFRSITVLKIHLRRHTGEKLELCQNCGKYFKRKSNLRNHRKICK